MSFVDEAIYEGSPSHSGSHSGSLRLSPPNSQGEARGSHAPTSASIDVAPQATADSIALTKRANSLNSTRMGSKDGGSAEPPAWKAGRKEWMVIMVLAIVSLMVALDATILVPVLPVSARP